MFLAWFYRYSILNWLGSCKVPLSKVSQLLQSPIYFRSQYPSHLSSYQDLILAKTRFLPIPSIDQVLVFNVTQFLPHKRFHQNHPSARLPSHEYCNCGRYSGLRSWRQPFMFATRKGLVDLSLAIGDKATTAPNVSYYHPDEYPSWPKCRPVYKFDPKSYCGAID